MAVSGAIVGGEWGGFAEFGVGWGAKGIVFILLDDLLDWVDG